MADGVQLNAASSVGDVAAADDVGGFKYQRVKIVTGADGTVVGDVDSSNQFPVIADIKGPVTVTGSVSIAGPSTITGAVTAAITGPVTVTGTVAATQSGSWAIAGPVTVTGSVTSAITGPVTVTGTVAATQSGSWAITGPVTVTGSVSAVGQVSIAGSVAVSQHTIQGAVSLAGGSVGIAGPVTVTGTVAATQSGAWSIVANASISNLLGSTVVNASTVVGTIGIAKRVDTQATVNSAVNTATPLHVNEFGSMWVVSEPGDAQTSNGGGVTGIQVFVGNATTVGSTVVANISGPMTVTGSVGIAGPVTVTGTVAATQSGAWSITAQAAITNLLGASVNSNTTVVGVIGIGKRADTISATTAHTVGGAVPLHTDAFGALWVTASSLPAQSIVGQVSVAGGSLGISGPVTVTGSVSAVGQVSIAGSVTVAQHTINGAVSLVGGTTGISGPVTVTGSVTAAITGPVTVTGQVSALGTVQGVTAHGTVASGNPVLVGFEGRNTDGTAVTTGAAVRALATLLGKLVTSPYAIPPQFTSYANATAGLATTVAATAFASAGASTRWYITSLQMINQGGAVTRAMIQDGAGALYYTASLATSGGGVAATFPVPLRIAANQTVEIKLDTTGTTVYTNLQGFKAGE